jgi:DNA polymerase-3 subunit beta
LTSITNKLLLFKKYLRRRDMMEIICKREELLKGIQTVQTVVGTKSALPVLANVLLEVNAEKMDMTATDLEVGVKCSVRVEVLQPGAITVPVRTLSEVVRELPSEDLKIKVDEKNRVEINSGQAVFNLMGLPSEDYPVLPKFKADGGLFMDGKALSQMIKKTIFSVSQDETRYVLCGIYFQVEKAKLKMVSTDGRRLSYFSKDIGIDKKKEAKVIIPTKAVNELYRILAQAGMNEEAGEGSKVKISIEQNQINFMIHHTVLISRLIEGHFPNYEQVIPRTSNIKLRVNTEELLQATKRVALLTTEKSNSIRYALRENKLIITANTEGLGEARDVVAIDYAGEEMEIAYNPQFLIDVLKNIGCQEVLLELTNSLNPCLIRPTTEEDYISIVMPMRI